MASSSTGMYEGASLDSELDIFSFVLNSFLLYECKEQSHMYVCMYSSFLPVD